MGLTLHRHILSPGSQAIRGCAPRSHGSQKSAATFGKASRKRAAPGPAPMEGALGRVRPQPLTGRRAEAILALALSVGSQIP